MQLFNFYIYNRNGRCLAGVDLPEDAAVKDVVDKYLEEQGTELCFPIEWDKETEAYWFGEYKGGRTYNRYVVPACGRDWGREN